MIGDLAPIVQRRLTVEEGLRELDAAIITAIGALITGIIGIVIAALTAHSAATKAELESLRKTITLLQTENQRLRERLDDLEEENGVLRDWAERLVRQVRGLGGEPERL
ncbi:MAG TPA: hypothetical protein VI729_13735 [Anaerolineales bacterium]|nr:hypothetical protein [Anaerolineales bacterium]